MKKILLVIVLMLCINVFGQKHKEIVQMPAIYVNSLNLRTTIKSGKEFFSFIKKSNVLINSEYLIMIRKRKVKKPQPYRSMKIIECDVLLNYGFKGISTHIYLEGFFFNGYKNGLWKTTFKNKLVKTENWNKGLILGRYRVYNMKGEILYKTTFGFKGNGKCEDYYYKSGILKQEGNYLNGKKEGKWCDYDEQGAIKKIIYYEKGTPIES